MADRSTVSQSVHAATIATGAAPSLTVAIVGGGAAGFFAAIATAEAYPQHRVMILEAGSQTLAKVRISGGGRCNVTHHCFDPVQLIQHYPRGGRALRGAFSRFQPQDTVQWFQNRGVALKTESDGRMFPVTDSSETIIQCLEDAAAMAGVRVLRRAPVVAVTRSISASHGDAPVFHLRLKSGEVQQADRLLLATGSSPQGHRLARSLGHTLVPPVPSLFTFQVSDRALHQRAGVSVAEATVRLLPAEASSQIGSKDRKKAKPLEQTGPVLITHWGLSGPAILKLSAWGARVLHEANYRATLQIQWLPQLNRDAALQLLRDCKPQLARKQLRTAQPFALLPVSPSGTRAAVPSPSHSASRAMSLADPKLPQRLWDYLLERSALVPDSRWADLSKAGMQALAMELSQGTYRVSGKGVFKEEFVTCGGVSLKEIDFKTLESRQCPGLYFAGEILDIDGVTGGFNFQSAWTTGWLAGQAIGAPP
ncbi:MAG: NAD(P)/FAD-dependent oxidoreductase [Prochlorothrix sp.]